MAASRAFSIIGPLLAWAACSVGSLLLQWHPEKTALDLDEVYWTGSAYYYDLAFVRWDWANPDWQLLPARENPPVAKYIIGLGLSAADRKVDTIDGLSYFYLRWLGWDKSPEVRGAPDVDKRAKVIDAASPGFRERLRENGRLPLTRPVIQAARNTIVVCAVLSSLLLFLLGSAACGHWLAGLVASQGLLLHPIVVSAYHHAMADIAALLCSLAAALGVFYWSRCLGKSPRPSWPTSVTASCATGGLLAIACGAKMNSLPLLLLAGALTAFSTVQSWLSGKRGDATRIAAHGIVVLLSTLAVFVLINPTILQDPRGGLTAVFSEHSRSLSIQVDLTTGRLTGLGSRMQAVVAMGFLGWIPFLAIAGSAAWLVIRGWREVRIRFIILWWLVTLVCVVAWLPFAWSRYMIPMVPPSLLLIGYLFASLLPRGALRTD